MDFKEYAVNRCDKIVKKLSDAGKKHLWIEVRDKDGVMPRIDVVENGDECCNTLFTFEYPTWISVYHSVEVYLSAIEAYERLLGEAEE